ncbi:F-box/FBD/LRR-repeat protein At3g26920-like [Ziziphus jujuba]|uniref:F-box/FBD/LRR-repeat protein At3g26920-like n=1 Tax=Ziziphus jujuba TaxID=326968 RepID=A0A6P6G458_ZIZJJ|nr:F-box/FBD/LRR-repeat protein At3g26920-like [Ziziphus jujuba]XP_048328217.1 F-box/FBD/LRR-repeat protein At3g26920-like [Ziziphus jujuba]
MGEDRISELPDPLIHSILSFLPTFYVVRMSILSKRWRRMWIHISELYFEEFKDLTFQKTVKSQESMFFTFVSNYLRHRKLSMPYSADAVFVTRFKLDMQYHFGSKTGEQIDDWLSIAVEGNVKELDLCIQPSDKRYYCLPRSVLNSRSLTILKLERLKLEITSPASLPSLKGLCLKYVEFDDEAFRYLISGCTSIEDFHLCVCSVRDIHLAVGGTLRSLSLWYMKLTNQKLQGLVCGLPLLEKLTLYSCQLSNVSIHSRSLKSLWFSGCSIEAKFKTPNLVHFVFEGQVKATISIDAPKLLEANLKLHNLCPDKTSFLHLILFLSYFKCLKKMTLSLDTYGFLKECLIVPKVIRNICCPPLPTLKQLKVKINHELVGDSEVRDSLLWCAPSVENFEIENQYCPCYH